MNARLEWTDKMKFSCFNREHVSAVDASREHGGEDSAPTPKELVLNAMMGCTAMDVVSILQKMRQELTGLEMEIAVTKNQQHPIHFKTAILTYILEGKIVPEKAIQAVESSLTKYCGVNYMMSKTCHISFRVLLNGVELRAGALNFVEPKD